MKAHYLVILLIVMVHGCVDNETWSDVSRRSDAAGCSDFWAGWDCNGTAAEFVDHLTANGTTCYAHGGFDVGNCTLDPAVDACTQLSALEFKTLRDGFFGYTDRSFTSLHLLFSLVGVASVQYQYTYISEVLKRKK